MFKPIRAALTYPINKKIEQIHVLVEWEVLMDKANDLFIAEHYNLAREQYEGCINYLLIYFLVCLDKDPEASIAALTVSHLNVVETYNIEGEYDLSSQRLEEALVFSMKLYLQYPMDINIQVATIRSIHHIMLEWAKLVRDHKQELDTVEINRYQNQKKMIFSGFQATYH